MAADLGTAAGRAGCMAAAVVNLTGSTAVNRVAASDFVGRPVGPAAVHSCFE